MAVTMTKSELEGSCGFFAADLTCSQLNNGERAEVLEFLAERPIHTVFMSTLIRDNGLVSRHNRGSFYACRNRDGNIAGVALIGHVTIVEARTGSPVAAFAQLAVQSQTTHLIRGERQTVDSFWKHFAAAGRTSRLVCRELLFETSKATPVAEPAETLRPATLDDIEHVLAVNALMALKEDGVDPFQHDPQGFRARTARRINQGRVWIGVQDGKPVFKADLVGDTPEMIYLEGIHVAPEERMKGHGKRCLAQLSSILLRKSQSICLTVNQRKADAVAFYARAGFDFHGEYETIYLG